MFIVYASNHLEFSSSKNSQKVYNIQEATTVNDVARSVPHIYAALDNNQADHQA
jgi:hypothetical protein